MNDLLIGTCGYDYAGDWKGVFYPDTLKHAEYLSFYAGQFNAVELDNTYRAIPYAKNTQAMVERTGGKLKFSVHSNQAFTHNPEIGKWRDAVTSFIKGIEPFMNAGVLTCVLLQFPYAFNYEREKRVYLADLIKAFGSVPLVAEFRNASWQRQSVYDGLEKMNVGLCATDMPSLKNLPQFRPLVLAGKGYMRFHGRNAANWYKGDARTRYEYRYTKEELAAYKPYIQTMAAETRARGGSMQVYFNNHARGNAAVNALEIKKILKKKLTFSPIFSILDLRRGNASYFVTFRLNTFAYANEKSKRLLLA
jgi:uncharacterized protein YecE (DUF72 family)